MSDKPNYFKDVEMYASLIALKRKEILTAIQEMEELAAKLRKASLNAAHEMERP